MKSLFVRVVTGGLMFLSFALALTFGVGGSAETVISAVYAPIIGGLERLTQAVFSKEMWEIVVKPILGWPSWIFPLLLAALVQVLAQRRARGVA